MLEATARSDIAYHPVCPPAPRRLPCRRNRRGRLLVHAVTVRRHSGAGGSFCEIHPPKTAETVSTSQQGPSGVEVPAPYDGLLPLPAEQADRGGGEREQCPCLGAAPDPPGGEDAQQVPVGEHDDVAAGVARPAYDPACTRPHLRCC